MSNKNFKKQFDRKDTSNKEYVNKRSKKEFIKDRSLERNDPSWYTRFPALAKAAGALYYGNRMGQKLDLPGAAQYAVAGINVIRVIPAIGISTDGSSSVNAMAQMIYSFTRHANAGSKIYERSDYMTYLLAFGSAYAFYASVARAYGVLRTYSVMNEYVSRKTVEAIGYDPDDLSGKLANLRYYLAYFATQLNQYAVPKDMTYYDRCAYLPLHIFKDNDNDKCSFYVIDYSTLWLWTGKTESTGSSLQPVNWLTGGSDLKTLDDIIAMGDQILNSLAGSEDVGVMSGDTKKAFGSSGLRELTAIEEDFAVLPEYDHNMLWQIHNSRIYDIAGVINNTKVVQSNNNLIFNPTLSGYDSVQFGNAGLLLDSDLEDPTFEFNFENTRLTPILDFSGSTIKFLACGTEIPIKNEIYHISYNVASGNTTFTKVDIRDIVQDVAGIWNDDLLGLMMYSTFKLHPIMYIQGESNQVVSVTLPYADLNNYTIVSGQFIKQVHDAATLSEFFVPNMAQAAK